ncbi:MAG: heavy-metal-associated domain-containing protein [Nanoarchaeota archaeon]|nr:heavy-metal-associated domain-containing protein [Nanoarchaeota archaeon]
MLLAFRVPTIKNFDCERHITQKLVRFPGVDHVNIDVDAQTVRLIYDKSRTTPLAIKEALQEIGHDAQMPQGVLPQIVQQVEEPPEAEEEFII